MGVENFIYVNVIWLLLLIVVAVFDFKYRRVKNFTHIAGAVALLFFMFLGHLNFNNFICGLLVFSIFLIFYKFNFVAAGDVKFSFLIGSFFGINLWVVIVFFIANIFSLIHGVLFIYRDKLGFNKFGFINSEERVHRFKKIPYAGYLAVSTILCMFYMPKP